METAKMENEFFLKIQHTTKNEEEEIKQLFIITEKTEQVNAKKIEGETVHTFQVDATKLSELLKVYKTSDSQKVYKYAVKDVYLYDWKGQLCIDPYDKAGDEPEEDEDQPIQYMDYVGEVKRTKVDIEGIRAFLEGTEGIIDISIKQFEEHGEKYYLLTSKNKEFYAVLMAKKEPNYKKVQEKLDKIIDEQKKLAYL